MEVLLKDISKGWKDIMIGLGQTKIEDGFVLSEIDDIFNA